MDVTDEGTVCMHSLGAASVLHAYSFLHASMCMHVYVCSFVGVPSSWEYMREDGPMETRQCNQEICRMSQVVRGFRRTTPRGGIMVNVHAWMGVTRTRNARRDGRQKTQWETKDATGDKRRDGRQKT